jgi:hypothetical protein
MWSSFAGVMLTTDEYAGLDAARRSALRAWVALGGQLCLSPSAKNKGGEADSNIPGSENLGAGQIITFPEPLGDLNVAELSANFENPETDRRAEKFAKVREEMAARRAARAAAGGSSPVAVDPMENTTMFLATVTVTLLKDVQLFAGTTGLPDRSALTLDSGPLFEATKEDSTGNAWLAVFLVSFAVIVGPVNLFLLAPAQKRHRLFVTTPLIAVAASLLLGVAILVQDGTGGTGERRACVFLLPGENQAVVIQEQAARTGFLTGRSFAFPDDVAMAVLPFEASISYGVPEVELERGHGRAGGDWFQSRARQAQQLRRVVPTRARIEEVGTSPNGAPIVQSSLGTTLRDFSFLDATGKTWRVAELPSGQRVTLQPIELRGTAAAHWAPGSDALGGSPNLRAVVTAAAAPLAPGRWSAFGGATELAPLATLASIRWKDSNVLYAGALENTSASPRGKSGATEGGSL